MSRLIVIGLILAVLLGSVAIVVLYKADQARSELPVLGTIGPFELVNRHGEPWGRDELSGKVSVAEFFFTSCRGPCPIMNGHFAELYRKYDASDRFQLVSFSVDPATDSLPVLQAYAEQFGVTDDRWIFLRGPMDTIVHICEDYFLLPAGDLPGDHSTRFVLLDEQARIRGFYSGTDPASVKVLETHIRELLKQVS